MFHVLLHCAVFEVFDAVIGAIRVEVINVKTAFAKERGCNKAVDEVLFPDAIGV